MDNVVEINRKRIFTIQEARTLLPILYRMTEEASFEVESFNNRIKAYSDKAHPAVAVIEMQINDVIDRWETKVKKLGAEPKGRWIADFDNGEGFFCWKYPEVQINFWHGYQDGYSGRILVE